MEALLWSSEYHMQTGLLISKLTLMHRLAVGTAGHCQGWKCRNWMKWFKRSQLLVLAGVESLCRAWVAHPLRTVGVEDPVTGEGLVGRVGECVWS